ncbi:MAG: pentapeptide repeat-containing protein [Chitinophagales bacterium]|nr:pentapeptide repeat-containing protein [Chitinophagales bacterium]
MANDTKSWIFAGKYSFSTPDGKNNIALNGTTLQIAAGNPSSPEATQQFNLYGDLNKGFTLQGPNWQYVTYNAGYQSSLKRGDAAGAVFILEAARGESFYLLELVDNTPYYVFVNQQGKLDRIAKDAGTAPETAIFVPNQITFGLTQIRQSHTTMANPLTGVYLAGQDLRNIGFMDTDVSFADFSGTILDNSSNFSEATANTTNFDGAVLHNWMGAGIQFTNCSFVGTNFTGANLTTAVMQSCLFSLATFNGAILQQTDFTNAQLVGCTFDNSKVNDAVFKDANLSNSDFSKAVGTSDNLDLRGAILIGTKLPNVNFTTNKIDVNTIFLNALIDNCVFTGMNLSNMTFARASMQQAKLDNCTLEGTQMAFADLSFASMTGAVSMIGANLANANLQSAQMPGAQLGSKKPLFQLPLSDAAILDQSKVPADLSAQLKLSPNAKITVIQPGQRWLLTDGSLEYQIVNNVSNLLVKPLGVSSNSAILSNAYMVNANLKQANLYAVEMSGAHWYGGNANAESADMGLANLSNANLNGMSFKQALMQGASFDYARLIGTKFDGAQLDPSDGLKPTSFAFSSMQSTQFIESDLFFANLTNAAYCLTTSDGKFGVPLFRINANLQTDLNNARVSNDVQNAFSSAAYSLISGASITVVNKDKTWTIYNVDSDDNTQVGYGNFLLEMVLPNTDHPNLQAYIQVYGAPPLLILENDGSGNLQQLPLMFGPTAVNTATQMNPETTCPSGIKLKLLDNHLSITDLMTAALPPKPPACNNCWG